MRFIRSSLTAILLLICVFAVSACGWRERILSVIVLPLDMHSKGDIGPTRRAVMDAWPSGLHSAGAEIVGIDELKELVLNSRG